MKKPSVSGKPNFGYLGHFKKDKFLQQGHNTSSSRDEIVRVLFDSRDEDPVKKQKRFEKQDQEVFQRFLEKLEDEKDLDRR